MSSMDDTSGRAPEGDSQLAPVAMVERDRPEPGRQCPVERVVLPDGRPVWMVNRYDAARQVLNDQRLSNDTSAMGANAPLAALPAEVAQVVACDMLNCDPPEHTRRRQLMAGAFTNRNVAGYRPMIERIVGELLGALPDHGEADLVEKLAVPLPTLVLAELLGIPRADCADVGRWSDTFVSELLVVSDRLLDATSSLSGYVDELVARKRAHPADDMVSRLIAMRDEENRLNDTELSSMVFMLLIAGQTATTQLIAKGLYLLLTHPGQLARIRGDAGLLSTAVDEFLRYDPPLRVSAFRMSRAEYEIAGTMIPAGEIVLCSTTSNNHDEDRFRDPDVLDVGRENNNHLAFGYGIHRCLGANLARLEAEVAIGMFLNRVSRPALACPESALPWLDAGIMRKLTSLPVKLG
jgi:cytochrome P450